MDHSHSDARRTLLLLRKDEQLLLAMKKRGFGEGKWNGVGGKLEPGETIEQALVRETQEEIGVTPLSWVSVGQLDFVQDADTRDPWRLFIHAYICEEWQGEPTESEEMRPQWFDISQLPYGSMWEDDEYWLPQVLNGKKVIGMFTFDRDDKLLTHDVKIVEELPLYE